MDFFLVNKQQTSTNTSDVPVRGDVPELCRDVIIKRGDYIKMIYKENGRYNMYKGYIGEIRDYRKGQDYAMIILHAMNDMKKMRVPIDHFIKLDQ